MNLIQEAKENIQQFLEKHVSKAFLHKVKDDDYYLDWLEAVYEGQELSDEALADYYHTFNHGWLNEIPILIQRFVEDGEYQLACGVIIKFVVSLGQPELDGNIGIIYSLQFTGEEILKFRITGFSNSYLGDERWDTEIDVVREHKIILPIFLSESEFKKEFNDYEFYDDTGLSGCC